jgi:predicted Zn-dependent protease
MDRLKQTAEKVMQRAVRRGATEADVLIREDDNFSVSVRMGEVETLKQAISRSMLLRVFVGKRTATSNTSDLSDAVVERLVDDTVEMAKLTSEDDSGGLPDASLFVKSFPDLDLIDNGWDKLTPQQRDILSAAAARGESEVSEFTEENAKDTKRQADAGIQTIKLEGAAAATYHSKAYEAGWAGVIRQSPVHGPKLREFFSKPQ